MLSTNYREGLNKKGIVRHDLGLRTVRAVPKGQGSYAPVPCHASSAHSPDETAHPQGDIADVAVP